MKKKINRCILFFIIFPVTGTNEKKIMKKYIFFVLQNRFGLLPNCIVKKKKFVLQGWYCIAIEVGWLLGGLKIVLQYNYCIAIQLLHCRQEKARLENFVLQYTIVL